MISLFIKLILAHIIGDFVLQPNRWVKDKKERKHRSPYLYWHTIIHALALAVTLQFNIKYWLGILVITVSHLFIDVLKLNLKDKVNERMLFFSDQIAHLLIIAIVVGIYEAYAIDIDALYAPQMLLLITAILVVTVVSAIFIKVIITKWELEEDPNEDSLENAGKYIGMLERLFVFGFVVTNNWQTIGFLIAAKSVFRFGDLSKSKDRKLTEYILIGTLLSFGFAITTALVYKYIAGLVR
ncbi:DUF3307 domain-containing protein [Fulvivirgaceae bacterium BMA12]|uniref:DUF3307 domain-containing protein n=1 Tax=Agaribacillus aureus TaxID=3051825 RepID=A0ABT8L2D1_9BACT|nr:DUF3307 domain-containing protein [Fulvivirgaceae bacterium BMA12]